MRSASSITGFIMDGILTLCMVRRIANGSTMLLHNTSPSHCSPWQRDMQQLIKMEMRLRCFGTCASVFAGVLSTVVQYWPIKQRGPCMGMTS
jgi:hypothetical protein